MFEKLLSNLPYNPSLVHQLRFYAGRMHREQSIRRTGLMFMVLAFFVQFFAVISPPVPTVANSTNDLIDGGIHSRSDAVTACKNNAHSVSSDATGYGDILATYGISCSDVAKASTVSLKSTAYNKTLYSLGRNQYGKKGEFPATIDGKDFYWRYLWSWDSYAYSTYTALKLTSSGDGKTYFILFNCGNLVSIGHPRPYQPPIDVCDNKKGLQTTRKECDVCSNKAGIQTSKTQCDVCTDTAGIQTDTSECRSCKKSISSIDTIACVKRHKTASDTTQGWADANNKTAQPGDVIVYTLYAHNNGSQAVKRFVFQENMSDVLDYADVTSLHGGKLNKVTGDVVWPAVSIAAGQTVSKKITVLVKDPLPQTPASTSDPAHFDLVMTNTYVNTINIKLPGGTVKKVETTAAALPNTGPGSSLIAIGAIVIVAGYFFARARLLATESALAIRQSANHGGM